MSIIGSQMPSLMGKLVNLYIKYDDVDAGDDAPTVGNASDCKIRGGHNATDATAHDDASVEDAKVISLRLCIH